MNRQAAIFLSIAWLPVALLASAPLAAREVPEPASRVDADGPYVFRDGSGLRLQWICEDKVESRALATDGGGADIPARCGYPHTLHVAPPAMPAQAVLPAVPRIVVLSDIHGQYDLLVRLLRANKVIDGQDHWSLGTDTLVVAGDVFDRGPKVTEAFWLLYSLQQQAADAGGAVHFVLGNHETMVLYDDLRYVNPKYLRSAQLLGRSYPQLYGADSVIGQWLRTRPVLLRIGDTLFLHGGISPDALELALDPSRTNAAYQASLGIPREQVKGDPTTAPLYDGKTSPIWYRGYFDGRLDTAGVQAVLDRLGLKRIVVGHTSMQHVSHFHGERVIAVDSSIKKGENGELLFIEEGRLSRGLLDGSRVALAEGIMDQDD
ncbi:metallophosphoesterase [Stenotrophomonas tumulicola]|uniref:Metallophosphoesterase n=1 Tax=Stenotrophomonas tumulicola TaxID=1685415 RepID=A0A7W3IFW5_9GAMM|nr:metallophosphoesterase [Stenotrophomonas tumulicola]MBA8680285.1 metallophosphoesterase [Stenotrophomonas tumulicola]